MSSFTVGDRVILGEDFPALNGCLGTVVREYHHPGAMVVRFDDPDRLNNWRMGSRQAGVVENDCHAFALHYLTHYTPPPDITNINQIEQFLNGRA